MSAVEEKKPFTRRTKLDVERYRPIGDVVRTHKIIDEMALGLVLRAARDGKKSELSPSRVAKLAERMNLVAAGGYFVAGASGAAASNLVATMHGRHEAAVCFVHQLERLTDGVEVEDGIKEADRSGDSRADLYCIKSGVGRVGVEVEMTQKSADRYDKIAQKMQRDLRDGVVDQIVYLTTRDAIAGAVTRAADEWITDPAVRSKIKVFDLDQWAEKKLTNLGVTGLAGKVKL